MLRLSVSTACSFICVLVMKQKTISLHVKLQSYMAFNANDKCVVFNPINQTIGTPSACLLILENKILTHLSQLVLIVALLGGSLEVFWFEL